MLAGNVTSILATAGKGGFTDWALSNLRHRFRYLYPVEILINVIRICWYFRMRIRRKNIVFNVHGAANLAPIFAARLLKIPLVWHFHETLANFMPLVVLGKRASEGIPHTYVVVAVSAKRVFSLPDATHIPGSVDVDFWNFSRFQNSEARALRLLAVGNINPLKGFDVLLRAMRGLNIPCKLVIAGAPLQTFSDYAADLYEQAAKLNSYNCCVEFAGWQSADAVRALLAETDIFVLPSRSEACPIALLEAMATGCACIATNVGDVADILSVPGSGLVVDSEDSEALSRALSKIAALGVDGRLAMGRLARERVIADYSLQLMASRHLGIYRQLVQKA